MMRAEPQLKPPGTDLRSGSTNPYDIQLLASTLSVVKSKEGEGKKNPCFNGYTGDLALSKEGKCVYIKRWGGNVELLQENQKSEKAADGLICSLVASEGLSHASPLMSSHVKIHHLKGKRKTVLRSPCSTLPW